MRASLKQASAVHIESHVDGKDERPSTSHTHQGVSSADNPEVPAGHAQGDSGVAAPFGGLGPIESGEDSCDEGPLLSHMQQGVSSADNLEVPAGHPQGDSGVAAPFSRPGSIVKS